MIFGLWSGLLLFEITSKCWRSAFLHLYNSHWLLVIWQGEPTLSEAIGLLGCRRNSPSGSVMIRQLTELQLWSTFSIGHHFLIPYSTVVLCHFVHSSSGLMWYPGKWMGNHLGQLYLNTGVFPAFNHPTQLNIDRKLTEMMIYSGMSYFFWECI